VASLTLAPEMGAARRPRRGADALRPWLGLSSALVVVVGLQATAQTLPAVTLSALVVLWPLVLLQVGFNRRRPVPDTPGTEARRVLGAAGRLGLVCWLLPVVTAALGLSASFGSPTALAVHVGALTALTAGLGLLARRLVPAARPGMVLVGHPDDVAAALPELRSGGHRPVGACLTRPPTLAAADALRDLHVRVGLRQTGRALRSLEAEGLMILPGTDVDAATVRRLQWQAAADQAEVYVATSLLDVHPGRVAALAAGGMRVVHVEHPHFQGPGRVVKDLTERVLALVAVVLLSPVLLATAVAVRLDSPGPALFRQTRVGRRGELFTMLKFRSMRVDAEVVREDLGDQDEGAGLLFKIREDPRVTPLGRWIRKFSVDELPQLWNVVRGEMSLVGPRPALPGEVEKYDFDPRRRLAVKPGLTGLWQVSGRSDLTWEQSVRLDVKYVDNWSLRLDLWILTRTVRAVLEHRGAY